MKQMILSMKENNEDFEFYPTTRGMLQVIHGQIDHNCSILDIGAGNGNALQIFDELSSPNHHQKYAIEKSGILRSQMPADIFILGTDFHSQTLIDKKVDVVFCNPPYSEYEEWSEKIILEANCEEAFLVIPQRWKESSKIQTAITQRNCDVYSLGTFSFMESEYRKARAEIEIVRVKLKRKYVTDKARDPFNLWFEQNFDIEHTVSYNFGSQERIHQNVSEKLVKGRNLIEVLEELYVSEFATLLKHYKSIAELDTAILEELGVSRKAIMEGLELKIKGLKNSYWKELFDNFNMITSRLIKTRRIALLDTLTANTAIDFTADNAYAVAIWVIKNANQYFDQQLIEVYDELTCEKNAVGYKSNSHWTQDGWQYEQDRSRNPYWRNEDFKKKNSRYILDYRLVMEMYQTFELDWAGKTVKGIAQRPLEYINDIFVIANNLGFTIDGDPGKRAWCPGDLEEFYLLDGTLFCDIRLYKKGTMHIKLNQSFMQKFNIEAGRLKGWLKNPVHASEETGVDISTAQEFFRSNLRVTQSDIKLLENNPL